MGRKKISGVFLAEADVGAAFITGEKVAYVRVIVAEAYPTDQLQI